MVHEIGVERVVAGDQHHQRAFAAAPGTTGLLPERGDRARVSGDDHRVEAADVHAEFEGVGGGDAEQLAVGEGALEAAAVVGQVPGAVGGHPLGQGRCGFGEQLLGA